MCSARHSGISPEVAQVSYATVLNVAAVVRSLGNGTLLAKNGPETCAAGIF